MVSILEAARSLQAALVGFEPGLLSGHEAALYVETLTELDKACAAATARAAARVEECGTHLGQGCRSGAEWLAKRAGTSLYQASAAIETAKAIEDLPATKKAYVSGRLSEAQASVVAKAAAADPSAEAGLLQSAEREDLRTLRDKARRVRLAAEDVDALHRRQHAAREFRHYVDDDGMVAGRFRLPPELGTPLVSRIEAETDRYYRKAYKEGRREERVANAADAFVSLFSGTGEGSPGRADLVVVVDLDALRRGHTHEAERCHIPGVSKLPVSVVRRIMGDAFLKAVLVDGTDITKVRHFGRHIPAELRTALDLGHPPELDGAVCVDCGRRYGIEWDHDDPKANGGPVSKENMKARCRPEHRDKTERDRQAGLLGGRDPP